MIVDIIGAITAAIVAAVVVLFLVWLVFVYGPDAEAAAACRSAIGHGLDTAKWCK